jgi:hypothetical protein
MVLLGGTGTTDTTRTNRTLFAIGALDRRAAISYRTRVTAL